MEKLLQFRVDEEVKSKLDIIFAEDGMTTQQALKVLAYNIAKNGRSPFSILAYEAFSGYISENFKKKLHEESLKELGLIEDDAEIFNTKEELEKAFKENWDV